ncbi:hypothetical protein D3C77_533230 [compost metagenome]
MAGVCDCLHEVVNDVSRLSALDPEYPYRAAGDFLQLCASGLLAFAWARAARCVMGLAVDDPLRVEKLESAGFFFDYLLPALDCQAAAVRAAQAQLPYLRAEGSVALG